MAVLEKKQAKNQCREKYERIPLWIQSSPACTSDFSTHYSIVNLFDKAFLFEDFYILCTPDPLVPSSTSA